ncbi:MAG: type I restriction enzyme S subunit [Oleiphilaceae bacterium]|jgi:type I restriction enzyme S subunit
MFFSTTKTDKLGTRLDASFYAPEYLSQEEKLGQFDTITIGQVASNPKDVTYGVLKPQVEPSGFLLARIQNFDGGFLNVDSCVTIDEAQFNQYFRSECIDGDIVVALGGYPGKACIINHIEGSTRVNINQHIARVRVKNDSIDSYYFLSYLLSNFGRLSLKRQITGSVQSGINLEDLRLVNIPVFNLVAQKYIGDKVRQAEHLRAWAKDIKQILERLEKNIPIKPYPKKSKKYSILGTIDLTDNRLDAEFYQDKHIDLDRQFTSEFRSLGNITYIFKYGSSVKADYVEKDTGIPFIRGNAIDANEISSQEIVYLDPSLEDDLNNNFLNNGDVMITRSGTVGATSDVYDGFDRYAYGSFIINCKPKRDIIDSTYLSWYLNGWVGQQQFRRWENGAVQLNINTEELAAIAVWIAPVEFQQSVAEQVQLLRIVNRLSQHLVTSAKLLVEELIKGQINEAELVAAQQALEAGDDSLDRALLERITAEGIDGEGVQLFDDVDQLYDLLNQADEAMQEA